MYRKISVELDSWKKRVGRKPLILRGARQVGKTHLLKSWGAASFPTVHYLNFEATPALGRLFDAGFELGRILQELGFFLQKTINCDTDLIIFDEIQAAPQALTSLKYFAENAPGLAVCAAGSLLGVSLHEASFPVGKVHFLYLHPLSFSEFLQAVDSTDAYARLPPPSLKGRLPDLLHEHLWTILKMYYVVGGMPEAVEQFRQRRSDLTAAFGAARAVQRELVTGYSSDFAKHAGKLNAVHIQALYNSVPSQLAATLDDSTKRFHFGTVLAGKKGFAAWEKPLQWLINADLVLQTKITNSGERPLEHFTSSNLFKLFSHDIGLLGCMQHLDPAAIIQQDYGTAKGYFAENFVAQELRASCDTEVWPLYAWSEGAAEIEFVRARGDALLPIEVKSGHRTKAKSLAQFRAKYHPPLSIKISSNNLHYEEAASLLHLPLYLAGWARVL